MRKSLESVCWHSPACSKGGASERLGSAPTAPLSHPEHRPQAGLGSAARSPGPGGGAGPHTHLCSTQAWGSHSPGAALRLAALTPAHTLVNSPFTNPPVTLGEHAVCAFCALHDGIMLHLP